MRNQSLSLLLTILVITAPAQQQPKPLSKNDRDRAKDMLRVVDTELRKHYYDPKFHGVDWDKKLAEAREEIDNATSMNMALSNIAGALDTLNDSHTFFLPPAHAYSFDYGWTYQMIGEKCFVTHVRPKSDADAKG